MIAKGLKQWSGSAEFPIVKHGIMWKEFLKITGGIGFHLKEFQ